MEPGAKRKGARRIADIPADIRAAIDSGQIATVNLVEFLSADLNILLPSVAAQIGLDPQHPAILAAVDRLPGLKPMQRHPAAAQALWAAGANQSPAWQRLASHASDLARQWAALQISFDSALDLDQTLQLIRPFAADRHFGVREFAWMALRPAIVQAPLSAIALLQPWVHEGDPNLRRFASEATRPRGVWCAHIEMLKSQPEAGLPLLEPLRADASKYVQDSVANWLNDAAKSRPQWTQAVCRRWLEENCSKATQRICQRAQRSIK